VRNIAGGGMNAAGPGKAWQGRARQGPASTGKTRPREACHRKSRFQLTKQGQK
jgi:hypothetical protein